MASGVVVVTGANRGIGLEVCRQMGELGYVVYLGSRDLGKGEEAAAPLAAAGIDVRAVALDVTDPAASEALVQRIEGDEGRVDVLVNNAAIHYDTWQNAVGADLDVVREAFETNVLGAWQVTEHLVPLLRRSDHGRIVNVSSGGGSLAEMGGGIPAYRVSKVALNALTRMWADELRRDRILVNSICPGWVATDMGGPGGRPVAEGTAGVVWAATLPDGGPTGGFFRDRQPVPW
jgi:NAD(P)-dependent dehydrogenase (short-subunit alcohol dehydrogenase family)